MEISKCYIYMLIIFGCYVMHCAILYNNVTSLFFNKVCELKE